MQQTASNNQDDIENVSYAGGAAAADTAPLTADLEPNFKKSGVSFAICVQIICIVSLNIRFYPPTAWN